MPPGVPPVPPQVPYPKWLPPPPPEGTGPAPEAAPAPAPGPQPQASGAGYTTYDQSTGAFKDPAGGTGIFAPGISGASGAENWVDLMLDPRPM
jgi:phospholipid/cholesterol/gamma-HCH transport system substrate-binding protein